MRNIKIQWKDKRKINKLIFFSFLLGILLLVACTNMPGKVSNPKTPSLPKPDDFYYCERDEDCTETRFEEESCCTRCSYPINKQGHLYLEELHNQNCENVRGLVCPANICSGISEIKCENKKCIGIPSKT